MVPRVRADNYKPEIIVNAVMPQTSLERKQNKYLKYAPEIREILKTFSKYAK